MTDRPSLAEIGELIADLRGHVVDNTGDFADLMDRKASMFERIAACDPDDAERADVARNARLQADRVNGRRS